MRYFPSDGELERSDRASTAFFEEVIKWTQAHPEEYKALLALSGDPTIIMLTKASLANPILLTVASQISDIVILAVTSGYYIGISGVIPHVEVPDIFKKI